MEIKMTQHEKYQALCFEAVITLDKLVAAFRHFMHGSLTKRAEDNLLDALRSNSDEFEDLTLVIKRTASVMQDIYYDLTGDTSTLQSIKKKVEELNSILHIGRSHPDGAFRRIEMIKTAFDEQALRTKNKTEA
jgi:hypothetical protein